MEMNMAKFSEKLVELLEDVYKRQVIFGLYGKSGFS